MAISVKQAVSSPENKTYEKYSKWADIYEKAIDKFLAKNFDALAPGLCYFDYSKMKSHTTTNMFDFIDFYEMFLILEKRYSDWDLTGYWDQKKIRIAPKHDSGIPAKETVYLIQDSTGAVLGYCLSEHQFNSLNNENTLTKIPIMRLK